MASVLRLFLFTLLLMGVFVTQFYVVGFELHRFYAPSWLFLGVAVLLLFTVVSQVEKGSVWIFSALGVLTGYVALRGIFSDVPSLTHKELPVLFYGVMTFLASAHLARYRGFFLLLVLFSITLLGVQLWYHSIPASDTYGLFKAWGERPGQNGKMFGFFRHYNPFASYCGLNAGVLTSLLFFRSRATLFNWIVRGLCLFLVIFSVRGAFLSGSRMGTAVTLFSVAASLFGGLSLYFLFRNGKHTSVNRVMLVLGIGVLGLFISGGVFTQAFNKVSEKRGMKGDLVEDVMGGMRISSIGMGFSLWLREPILGKGPRAYSYYAPSLRRANSAYDNGNYGHPDAEMVHNDYIQTLAEYGLIGFILVILTLSLILFFLWKGAWEGRDEDSSWFVAPVGGSAAVAGIMVHSLGDFTMHSTPVFLCLALILGVSYGWTMRTQRSLVYDVSSWGGTGLKAGVVLVASAFFVFVGQKQIRHTELLVRYDRALWKGASQEYFALARKVAQKAPDSFVLETLGFRLLKALPQLPLEQRESYLREAEAVLEQGIKLHPYRIEILSNLARTKLELKKDEEAYLFLSKALRWSGDRWRFFNLSPVVESYLVRQGELAWEQRKASDALAYFVKARDYNERGYWSVNKKKFAELRGAMRQKIENNIQVLESGKVLPSVAIENALREFDF